MNLTNPGKGASGRSSPTKGAGNSPTKRLREDSSDHYCKDSDDFNDEEHPNHKRQRRASQSEYVAQYEEPLSPRPTTDSPPSLCNISSDHIDDPSGSSSWSSFETLRTNILLAERDRSGKGDAWVEEVE